MEPPTHTDDKAEHMAKKAGHHRGKEATTGKNDRRPHSHMRNHGRPKKGGAGGKGTWGRPGDEIDPVPAALDKGDPNYDSAEDEEAYVLVTRYDNESTVASKVGVPLKSAGVHGYRDSVVGSPPRDGYISKAARRAHAADSVRMTLATFKKRIQPIIDEYLESEDAEEVGRATMEIKAPFFHYELVKRAVTTALGKHDRERELVSVLISSLYPRVLNMEHVGKGFERLFELADDLVLDNPNAYKLLAQFVGRAVVDEVLPPSFLADPLVEDIGGPIVKEAKVLLSMKHGTSRLESIWCKGSDAPLPELKASIKTTVEEFLLSQDLKEAERCIRELDVPHFHHELVKRAIVVSIDQGADKVPQAIKLLQHLRTEGVLSVEQAASGFRRVAAELDDLALDNPKAKELFKSILDASLESGALAADWQVVAEAPTAATAGGAGAGAGAGAATAAVAATVTAAADAATAAAPAADAAAAPTPPAAETTA